MNKNKILLSSILIVTTGLLAINPSLIGSVNAQPYEEEYDEGYDNGYRYHDGYDNGYDHGYLEKDKKTQIFPTNKVAELGDKWWQWILSLDVRTNPNPFTETGQEGCDIGLQDNNRLLYLVGSDRDSVTGFPVHECKIEKGITILFPIFNVFCAGFERDPPLTEAEQRICANEAMDFPLELQLEIDGNQIQNLERQHRVDSPPGGFEFNAVEGNPITTVLGESTGVSDGAWILLKHLTPGEHTITFSGKLDLRELPGVEAILEAGATYNLFVKSGYY